MKEETAAPRGRRAFAVLGGLLFVVVGGIGVYTYSTANRETTDDAVVEAEVLAVTSRVPGESHDRSDVTGLASAEVHNPGGRR